MNRRTMLKTGATLIAPGIFVANASTSIFAKAAGRPLGAWDGPVLFKFETLPGTKNGVLNFVGYLAEYHGREFSERIYLKPDCTLDDVIDATQFLQGLANDTLNYLVTGQL